MQEVCHDAWYQVRRPRPRAEADDGAEAAEEHQQGNVRVAHSEEPRLPGFLEDLAHQLPGVLP
jgi:hypothetical protein